MDGFDINALDETLHGKIRLAVMAYLSGANSATFTALKLAVGTSDGNLSVHVRKLEEAGHVTSEKAFVDKKPMTTIRLTSTGRTAWIAYLDQLQKLLDAQKARI
jgi:DNA-binding MarR family transcriptional regulator